MFLQGIRLSLASFCSQLMLIAAFWAVSTYSQPIYGQGELSIPAKPATSSARAVLLPGSPLLLFGLLGLAVIVAALSVRMVCSSPVTSAASSPASSPASQRVNAPEQTVLSHFT